MNNDVEQAAIWTTEYYLEIITLFDIPGEGWYRSGQSVLLEPWSPRGTIIKDVFTGWSGDIQEPPNVIQVTIIEEYLWR